MNKIDNVYILHFEPLIERKKYLDSFLKNLNIPYEYVINNNTTDSIIKKNIELYYKYDKKILERKMTLGEISVSVSHLNVYKDILKKKYNYCLVLEDDAVFIENFERTIELVMNEKKNYDFIFLSSCCNLKKPKLNNNFLYESDTSRCATGYIVSNKKLKEIIEFSTPFSTPIDAHLNHIKNILNLKYAWCEPTLINQGSENVYKSNLR